MISLETSVSLASLGLIVMFVLLMYSFISFLIGPQSQGPDVVVQPEGVLIQIVSISAGPGIILAGITYGLIKNYGSRKIGIILCISGIVLIIGNILVQDMISRIPQILFVPGIHPLTYALLAARNWNCRNRNYCFYERRKNKATHWRRKPLSEKLPIRNIYFKRKILPIEIFHNVLNDSYRLSNDLNSPVLSVVIGTKPDFYKQAPVMIEALQQKLPAFVIDTGQHFDDLLGFGIQEFELQDHIACNLQIRGDLMEKASELILKFGSFGRYLKKNFGNFSQMLPIVHGDTLVAGIAPLAWVFGMGQKVAQNEAGLRSMSPESIKYLKVNEDPTKSSVEKFVDSQFEGRWFLAREEPFPEQIDTWICSAGTQFFFAPTQLNKDNLVREGYPEEFIHVVGNSVVDAIEIKRKNKPKTSMFDIYPKLETGEWIRLDIHRRENLTEHRFSSIIKSISYLIKNTDYKLVLIMLNAMKSAPEILSSRTKSTESGKRLSR